MPQVYSCMYSHVENTGVHFHTCEEMSLCGSERRGKGKGGREGTEGREGGRGREGEREGRSGGRDGWREGHQFRTHCKYTYM